jgi:unsaturated chondroitin disaccharide hydrolase
VIQFELDTDKALFEGALDFAEKQVRALIEGNPDFYPIYTLNGKWKHEGQAWTRWCDGFLPGMMWIFHKRALLSKRHQTNGSGLPESSFWFEKAIAYSQPLESRQHDRDVHDLGFIFFSSYYRWYQATKEPDLNVVLMQAGQTLAQRFQEKGQYLRSFVSENSLFIDIMMNVGLVFYAAREIGDRRLRDIAMRHCLTTRRYLVRGDGSVGQEGLFDTNTGEFLKQATHQGYRSDSCWSRGLTWALYGFSTCYEYSRDPRLLETAEKCADYYITHSPSDGVPPWDFQAPNDSRRLLDTSAAAIAASALLRLCRLLPDPVKGHFYWNTAIRILRSLCEKHLANRETGREGVLMGGVYHMQRNLGISESVMWGDYFFVEALLNALFKR